MGIVLCHCFSITFDYSSWTRAILMTSTKYSYEPLVATFIRLCFSWTIIKHHIDNFQPLTIVSPSMTMNQPSTSRQQDTIDHFKPSIDQWYWPLARHHWAFQTTHSPWVFRFTIIDLVVKHELNHEPWTSHNKSTIHQPSSIQPAPTHQQPTWQPSTDARLPFHFWVAGLLGASAERGKVAQLLWWLIDGYVDGLLMVDYHWMMVNERLVDGSW